MKLLMALTLFINFSVFAISTPPRNLVSGPMNDNPTVEESAREASKACSPPTDLLPATKILVDSYLRNNLLNSTFLDDFLWLQPQDDNYAICLICTFGKPNDPYWETDFNLRCDDFEMFYAQDSGNDALI